MIAHAHYSFDVLVLAELSQHWSFFPSLGDVPKAGDSFDILYIQYSRLAVSVAAHTSVACEKHSNGLHMNEDGLHQNAPNMIPT